MCIRDRIPDTLWKLWVLDLPALVRCAARGAAQFRGIVVIPRSAARAVGIGFGGLVPGIRGRRVGVVIRIVLIERPLGDIAENVIQAPWIRLLLADFLIFEVGVLSPPAVLAHRLRIIAPEVSGRGTGARGVFP